MAEHKVIALEGIDGSGKSTAGKIVAEKTGGTYLYCMDGNPLKPLRKRFDGMPTPVRFLYYLAVPLLNYQKIEKMRSSTNVFLDRSVASTIAYHRAYGLPERWFKLLPNFLLDQVDTMLYFTVSEEERMRRMTSRQVTKDIMTESDKKSIQFARKIDAAYRTIFQDRTIIINTDNKDQEKVAQEVIDRLQESRLLPAL